MYKVKVYNDTFGLIDEHEFELCSRALAYIQGHLEDYGHDYSYRLYDGDIEISFTIEWTARMIFA
jgi:hypothetical protein